MVCDTDIGRAGRADCRYDPETDFLPLCRGMFCVPVCLGTTCVPKRERQKKFQGCWHTVEEILFPGYVFGITDRPGELYQNLQRIPKLTRILGREEGYFVPLNREEEALVRKLGDGRHRTGLSRVEVMEGKQIRVVEGPLKDYVGDVVKVNLHKREVAVKVEFMGRSIKLYMGIEMVETGNCGD